MQTYRDPGRHQFHLLTKQPASEQEALDYSMQRNYLTNPSYRAQQTANAAPASQFAERTEDQQSSWLTSGSYQRPHPHSAAIQRFGKVAGHKRNSSGSTVASTGPSSPSTPVSSSYPHIVDSSETPNYLSLTDSYEAASNYIPIPHTKDELNAANNTFTASFFPPELRDYPTFHQDARSFANHQFGMKAMMAHEQTDVAGGQLLRKASTGEFAEDAKMMESRSGVPKLDRTMSDIYQDELYNPNMALATPASQPPHGLPMSYDRNLSPRRDVFSERLQAANNGHMSARSGSPADALSRERSPFRPTSQFVNDEIPPTRSSPPGPRLGSVAQIRERQKAEADARAFARHHQSNSLSNSRTISPKEALLDIRDQDEESMPPLFNADEAPSQPNQHEGNARNKSSECESIASLQGHSDSSNAAIDADAPTLRQQHNARRQRATSQTTQQYPFISQPRRQNSSLQSNSENFPDFPAHITSMDSTRSETRSTQSQSDSSDVRRPASTTADSGTYSCTYHGCTMRFETPVKLQRHKRDGHRQGTPPSTPGADAFASRNSQAGPHKCERINPSTGKPCNSIFSRPYDLTRHEDTIHNVKKQKVKCQFCTEDKTFSRNDALTRHMRVVHPEVDFPGKTKRKG
ncbi:MAG: hypothetical protein MMC23_009486 [Stictis urceolatum]|nr:hypothetical protein [Stictis urceolata]